MRPVIVETDCIVGGYRRFLVWPMFGMCLDVALIDGETYHCHPALPIGETMGEEWGTIGRKLAILHGYDVERAYVSPVRWKDNYIDHERWQGLIFEHKNVETITLNLKG